ncbi:MAG: hypothetical protein HOG89_03870 [Candidatus Peribacter sp.]|jgi:hypothetical protein|nr:hypothetical protein [Candidatus Peribacter sp.]MBT4393105.1 hypothetical protein [Candidatus Peribacter sp.]MBT4600904.1 hypothetical protein [Candidatus Peribacter sp.]MBT5148966.1 hypothetical protein [Candidatus Peribacter sp.]MBT5638355.1 hypothetical protein [Candidatus Peribacter sp.]
MKSVLLLIGLGLIGQTYAADVTVPDFSGRPYDEHPILAPCTRFDDRYQNLLFRDTYIEEWPEIYHDQVDRVVQEYLQPRELKCDAEDYETFLPPGGELLSLAAGLPTWNDPDVPLSEYDISRVLLEYLRVYECALMEFDEYLVYDTAVEQFSKPGITKMFFSGLMEQFLDRSAIINEERVVARVTLHRVLTLIGNFGRLRPLEAELECTQRLSLDIRNISALTAETSSCLPRIWNAKDVLRDYKEE